jgi:hypothetical protein
VIISHKHKFIFIKTRKTAGSSIEHFLSNYLGPNDICTGSDIDGTPRLNNPHKKGHIDYKWIEKHYPKEWKSYYKFAVERNPWDKMISYFHWHLNSNDSFEEFCLDNIEQYNCWFRYANKDKIMVDNLMRYEDIHNEIKKSPLPYNNEMLGVFKKKGPTIKVKHTYNTIEAIRKSFNNVIRYFNYDYNS